MRWDEYFRKRSNSLWYGCNKRKINDLHRHTIACAKRKQGKKTFYEHGISIFPPRLYTVFVDNSGGRLQAQFAA